MRQSTRSASPRESRSPIRDVPHLVLGHDAAEAQVEPEPAQQGEACGEPVDLQVAIESGLASATGCATVGVEPLLEVGDLRGQAGRDPGEVLHVVVDECGICLGGVGVEGERVLLGIGHVAPFRNGKAHDLAS